MTWRDRLNDPRELPPSAMLRAFVICILAAILVLVYAVLYVEAR